MTRAPRQMLMGAAACAVAFGVLLVLAYRTGPAQWLDFTALNGLVALESHPRIAQLAETVAHLSDPVPFAACTAVLFGVALIVRGIRHAAAVALLLVGANVSSQALKPLLAHPRDASDWPAIDPIMAAAFPSGHTTASMSLALAAVLVAPRTARPLVAVVGLVFTLAVSLSLLILNWHLPSDVVGGQLLATSWALASLAALRAAAHRWPERGSMLRAARDSVPLPSYAAAAGAAGIVVVALGTAGILRAGQLASYAQAHTTAVAVSVAVAVSGAALVAAVTALSARRHG